MKSEIIYNIFLDILSLRNTTDERVQGSLEELLEGIKYDRLMESAKVYAKKS